MKEAVISDKALVELWFKVMEQLGEVHYSTVGAPLDPTKKVTSSIIVYSPMTYAEFKAEGKTEPPNGEMVKIQMTTIWDTEITITGLESKFTIELYEPTKTLPYLRTHRQVQEMRMNYDTDCEELMTVWKELPAVEESLFLQFLLLEGDWSGEDPRTAEEDPIGQLSDYE